MYFTFISDKDEHSLDSVEQGGLRRERFILLARVKVLDSSRRERDAAGAFFQPKKKEFRLFSGER